MIDKNSGWVVICVNHPYNIKDRIYSYTFARTRKESIHLFVSAAEEPWKYWKKYFGFKCVKATQTITIIE